MKKKLLFKLFIFAVIGAFVTVTSCKDYDDDISRLDADLTALKNSVLEQADLTALQTQLTASIAAVQTDLNAAKATLAALQGSAATQEDIDAAKAEVLGQVVKLETFNSYKEWVDGEIATLKTDLANAASKEEVEALETLLNSEIASVREELSLTVANLEALTVIVEGNSDAIADVETQLADQLAEIEANATEIAALKADLEQQVEDLTAEIDALKALFATMQEDIDAFEAALEAAEARMDGIDTEIETINSRIDALEAAIGADLLSVTLNVNSMITGISFDYENDDVWARWRNLNFSTAPAKLTWTFGQGLEGAIAFTKDARILDAEQTMEVKVNPATADLSTMLDKIYLIRRDGNNQINNFIVPVKAERSTALRAAPSVTGLWNITFKMPATANVAALPALTEDTSGKFYFALAIENSVDTSEDPAERYVISDFSITIDASTKTPIYNDQDAPNDLIFSVKKGNEPVTAYKPHTDIKNRYAFTENAIPAGKDQMWSTGVWNTTATPTADDDDDDRLAKDFFGVEVGKTFNVKLDNPDKVFAYYIVLDKDWAVESAPSEWNAWSSYDIEGINKVYRADEVANIQINSTSANGDIIGFRVVSVNYDGTLVDPDGKSFYTYVGDVASSALAFTQTITAPVTTPTTTVPTNTLAFAPAVNLANVGSASFTMNIGHSIVLGNANLEMLDASDAVTANWADVKKLRIIGVKPSDLAEGVTYTGTLTLNNTLNVPFSTTNITLTKVLPTFDGTGIGYKTSIHHDVNGQPVVYAYPKPATMEYNLANALNGIGADGAGYQVVNVNTTTNYPAASLPAWDATNTNTEAVVPVAEIGVPYEPAAQPGHGKIFDLRLSKNFGYVLYDGSADYLVYWAPAIPIKVEFRSFVQDLKDWLYTGTNEANTPALKYGADLTGYSFTNITALPPAGARVDLTNTPGLQDGRTFTVTGVRVLTGANFDVANEYFVPAINGTAFDFTAVITSTPAGPVPTKLEVELTDNFGHAYTFVVPKVFDMTLN
jgi:predicted  nucleic acid-binding Zn-ribbon protein